MKQRLKTLIKLAVWASVAMYLINKFIESSAVIGNFLRIKEDSFYSWKHGKIYYTKTGSGSPLLLLHDLSPSASQQEWAEVIDSLAENHTVYAVDLLGCGRSEKPNITYTNYLFAQLIADFARDMIGETCFIAATGKSASCAVIAAQLNPDLFGDLTLINPDGPANLTAIPNPRSKILKAILDLPIVGVSVYYLLSSRNELEYDFSEKYFYNPFHLKPQTLSAYYESAHLGGGGGRHLLASINGYYVNFDIRFAFSKLQNNIHIIMGSEQVCAKNIANFYKDLNSSVTCSFVEKTKMLPQLEAPEKFIAAYQKRV